MFYGKRIKELEAKVAALQTKVETLGWKVLRFVRQTEEQAKDLDRMLLMFEQQDAEKVRPNKKVANKPKKNGKENNSAK